MSLKYYSDKVLITGASGFVASHIVSQLFSRGVQIVGTVRSAEKGDWIAKRYPGFKYEVLKDVADESAIQAIFKKHSDISHVLHTAATRGPSKGDAVKNLVEPSVNSINYLLKAARDFGPNVKKFVMTSSCVTMLDLSKGPFQPDVDSWVDFTIDNSNDSMVSGFAVAKKLAEKAVWKFKETQKPKFSVATMVIPGVFGPPIHQVTYSTLGSSIAKFRILLSTPADTKQIPPGMCGHADVRDIARAHVNSLFDSNYDNGRWLIMEGVQDNQAAIDVLHKYRPQESSGVVVGSPNSLKRENLYKFNNEKTRKVLGFELIPFKKSIIDMYDAVLLLQKEEQKDQA